MNFSDLFNKAISKRAAFFQDQENSCFRLFSSDGDGIDGLTIDYYDGVILMQFFDPALEEKLLNLSEILYDLVSSFLPVSSLYFKNRCTLNKPTDIAEVRKSRLLKGKEVTEDIVVRHNGIRMLADPVNSQSTGVFMDMRTVRERISDYYPNISSLLNLFCYTSAFSIHALRHGVSNAVNVDVSKPVLERSKQNYELNDLAVDHRNFVKEDAKRYLKWCIKKGITFDLVILDPPTFARSKKAYFSVKKDYAEYLQLITQVSGKYLLSAINTYTVTHEEYVDFHQGLFSNIFMENEAFDHAVDGESYLKCGLWEK